MENSVQPATKNRSSSESSDEFKDASEHVVQEHPDIADTDSLISIPQTSTDGSEDVPKGKESETASSEHSAKETQIHGGLELTDAEVNTDVIVDPEQEQEQEQEPEQGPAQGLESESESEPASAESETHIVPESKTKEKEPIATLPKDTVVLATNGNVAMNNDSNSKRTNSRKSFTSNPNSKRSSCVDLGLNIVNSSPSKSTNFNEENESKITSTNELSIDELTSIDSLDHSYSNQLLKKNSAKSNKWFDLKNPSRENYQKTLKNLSALENQNLAYSRLKGNNDAFNIISNEDKKYLKAGKETLKKTFNEVKIGVENIQSKELIIDWEFWSLVVNDYGKVVEEYSDELLKNITLGFPHELRGMIWQIICESKSSHMEEFYINMRNKNSNYEKQIRRDLSRTSFVMDSMTNKIEDLFRIIKLYSLYDTEVGYTQGMAFITVPLLMNMEPSESFCMLVKLMFTYGFRDFYLPEMPGLHLKMYQLDRLIEDFLPELYIHFKTQGIKCSMYATQWFLTLFAYKFPLDLVLRIFDVVIAEGLESILKFSLNLLIQNEQLLLTLTFDQLLFHLKEKIFECYLLENENSKYDIDNFVSDAMEIELLPLLLNKYSAELEEITRLENLKEIEIEELRIKNGQLARQIREIEMSYAILNREHVEIANEMVRGKVKIGDLDDQNETLQKQIDELTNRLSILENESKTVDFSGELSEGIDIEIQKAMERNVAVMNENMKLEDELARLETENKLLRERKSSGWKSHAKFW
ncbi:GTPase-activating protein [Martiniozyma asiatica (nom. inval.)]|nr:GTPase-activating protein [Martiniozyma asiatica]